MKEPVDKKGGGGKGREAGEGRTASTEKRHKLKCVISLSTESPVLSRPVVPDSLRTHGCSPPGSCVYGHSSGKNTGVGCHALLQGIFPTQGSNPGLPERRQILYCLSHRGGPEETLRLTDLLMLTALVQAFSRCRERGLLFAAVQALLVLPGTGSRHSGPSMCSTDSVLVVYGLSCSKAVESSRIRDRTSVFCIGRRFLSTEPTGKSLKKALRYF